MTFPEKRVATFRKGVLETIDEFLRPDEDRTGFIRDAVDREIERRIGIAALQKKRDSEE